MHTGLREFKALCWICHDCNPSVTKLKTETTLLESCQQHVSLSFCEKALLVRFISRGALGKRCFRNCFWYVCLGPMAAVVGSRVNNWCSSTELGGAWQMILTDSQHYIIIRFRPCIALKRDDRVGQKSKKVSLFSHWSEVRSWRRLMPSKSSISHCLNYSQARHPVSTPLVILPVSDLERAVSPVFPPSLTHMHLLSLSDRKELFPLQSFFSWHCALIRLVGE